MTKKADVGIDVTLAGTGATRTVSNLAKCPMCRTRFKAVDAVIRIRDYAAVGVGEVDVHRRCMVALLDESIEDKPVTDAKFEAYRAGVAEKLGIHA